MLARAASSSSGKFVAVALQDRLDPVTTYPRVGNVARMLHQRRATGHSSGPKDLRRIRILTVGKTLIAAAAAFVLASCASHNAIRDGYATKVEVTQELPPPDPRDVGGALQKVYYIGPADKLSVFVASLPEMTQTVLVDPSGYVSLPIVGRVLAGGRTTEEVRDEISAKLSRSVLVRPVVSVGMSDTASQRITLEGAVSQPGIYPLVGNTTLLRALSMGRGVSNLANERTVAVFRDVEGKRMVALFDLHMVRQGTMADPTIYGNDLIVVERSRGKQLLRDIIGTMPLIGAFYTIDRIVQ